MAAPTILSVVPANVQTDVVLGTQITVTFDQIIDTTTVTDSTFSLTGPGQTAIVTVDNIISQSPDVTTGREFITGAFSFSVNDSNQTVLTFNPGKPLQPNQTYTVMVVGADSGILPDTIKNLGGQAMANTFQWSFTTGILNLRQPPVSSPLPDLSPEIDPKSIVITPRATIGNNLSQEIDIIFPGTIDPASFNLADILLSIDPIVGDPSVPIPPNLTYSATVLGNKIIISITGWPP